MWLGGTCDVLKKIRAVGQEETGCRWEGRYVRIKTCLSEGIKGCIFTLGIAFQQAKQRKTDY